MKAKYNTILYVPPGHFYSPIPSLKEIEEKDEDIFEVVPKEILGIDLNESEQLDLVNEFLIYYKEIPFEEYKVKNLRYFFENDSFLYSDAIFLYSIIRNIKPQKIIEIGCGYSSCVILDTNELYFNGSIDCTFIDPYPQRLFSLMKNEDKDRISIVPKKLQNIARETFSQLSENDILFVDSTHIVKTGSDVNIIFSDILPQLNKGVYIHFHDIFYPFEYPRDWVYQGRAWNEAYLLREFLRYNNTFKIVLFNTFLEHFHSEWFYANMPLCMKNKGGSIWLKKQ